ncbi:MAG: nitroreductase family protein [Deltaproteobacteria bacterium]|jgi:nitroreductase/NAD-dependent dihydropyrimidine dehydrogenase PreA subunit|nr:nitroreductase family protein [Deltaproteobacteria bacterium]
MLDFVVDRERCVHCGECLAACGRGVLVDNGAGGPEAPPENEAYCNFCGHCSAVCPTGAVISPGCNGERAAPLDFGSPVDFAAASRFLLSCRSLRRFREEEVSREKILEIIDVARRAPTASNAQALRWLVMSGREKARRFTALTMEWFDSAVRLDPVLNGRYGVDRMMAGYRKGHDPILRGAPCAVFVMSGKNALWGPVDSSIALTYFCLAASAGGIGSCWCGFGITALRAYAPLRGFLGLDDDTAVQAMAFFGYPALRYRSLPPRRPPDLSWL